MRTSLPWQIADGFYRANGGRFKICVKEELKRLRALNWDDKMEVTWEWVVSEVEE